MAGLKNTRRRFSFSSRTALLTLAIFAVSFAALGNRAVREINERRAISKIQQLGGRFDFHSTKPSLTASDWPSRVVTFVLYEDFSRVTGVSVDRTTITDDDLALFKLLTKLEGLDISSTGITDASVEHLAEIPALKYLNAYDTELTEAGMAKLKSLRPSLLVER